MAAVEHEIRNIASYLCVSCGQITQNDTEKTPVLKNDNGTQVKGLASIAKYMARKTSKRGVLGASVEDEAIINQWLEYRVSYIDRCADLKDLEKNLQELNSYMSDKVYFVGHHITLADLVLFHALHKVFNKLTFFEKQKYMHLSRWYNQVQHCEGVSQGLPLIFFQKNMIYTGSSH